jgi:Ni/Co efflux regulator RcnB
MPPNFRGRQYVVDDWRGHGLRRPPHGYQWVQNGSDYVLVAITTGIILELLLNH